MTSQPILARPPRLATWLVNLFSPADRAESILGDLHEEFRQIGSKAGADVARDWYWRQSLRAIAHLAGGGFRGAPWSTTGAIIGGFLLLRFAHRLPDRLLTVLTDKYLMYWSDHFSTYLWLLRAMSVEYLMGSLFTGCVFALAARGLEMVATVTLALILGAMTTAGVVWFVAHSGDVLFLWKLPWFFADPVSIVLGGIIVRQLRSAAATRASA